MSTTYSTITSKGQITLPSALRRKLGLSAGLRVALREVKGGIVVEAPPSLDAVRAKVRAEMEAAGTWGSVIDADGAWAAAASDRLERAHG